MLLAPDHWKVPAVTQLHRPTGRWLEVWKCFVFFKKKSKNLTIRLKILLM